MVLRKYASDPSIRAMMGTANDVRFTGKIVDKLDDGRTIVLQVEVPDNEGFVRGTVKLTAVRFAKVSVFDTITGKGELTRHYKNDKLVMSLTPHIFNVRNSRNRQVI